MRVAIVAPKVNLETGGGSHYSLLLYVRGLRELEVEVEVYSLDVTSTGATEEFAAAGAALHFVGAAGPAEQAERLGAVKCDVLLVDAPMAVAYEYKRRFPRRRVAAHINTLSGFCTNVGHQQAGCWLACTHRDRVRHHPGRLPQRAKYLLVGHRVVTDLARGFRSLDGCIFPSPQTVEAYRVYRLDPARCFVVPECLDLDLIARFQVAPFRAGDGPLTLLYVGSLAEYKGMALLFEALRRVQGPWRLRIYGDGPDRGRVLAFAEEFRGRVDFRGHVANSALFADVDGGDFLFVHPCLWFEALGRGILEAMALGIPVLVPDVGGPAWSVTEGLTGLHYGHRDPAALAERIEWAAAHAVDVRRMAGRAREAARAYGYRRIARLWSETLERIAAPDASHA